MKSVKAAHVLALGIVATISIGGYINQNVQASDIVFEDGEEEPRRVPPQQKKSNDMTDGICFQHYFLLNSIVQKYAYHICL